jgi:hypothetical protein
MPEMDKHLNPMPYEAAAQMEQNLAPNGNNQAMNVALIRKLERFNE